MAVPSLIPAVVLIALSTVVINSDASDLGYGYCMPPWAESWGKPNVIIFNADDMGWGDLSSYGHPTQEWGAIDDMATNGMRFTNFYSPSSVCSPSRAGLFTGGFMSSSKMSRKSEATYYWTGFRLLFGL